VAWLAEHGALAGIAEILCERRRQVDLEMTAPADGRLLAMAQDHLARAFYARSSGASSADRDTSRLRRAGALAAAEIDRLSRLAAVVPGEGGEQ
jgi:hypothetical protein